MGYRICFWIGYSVTMMIALVLFPFIYARATFTMSKRRRNRS